MGGTLGTRPWPERSHTGDTDYLFYLFWDTAVRNSGDRPFRSFNLTMRTSQPLKARIFVICTVDLMADIQCWAGRAMKFTRLAPALNTSMSLPAREFACTRYPCAGVSILSSTLSLSGGSSGSCATSGFSWSVCHSPVAAAVGRLAAWLAGVPIKMYTAHGFYFHDKMPALPRSGCSAGSPINPAPWAPRCPLPSLDSPCRSIGYLPCRRPLRVPD